MTKRKLPVIEAFATVDGVEWDPPVAAEERWTPVRAAREDERSINMFGPIGEDPFSDSGVTDRLVSAALRRMGAGPVTVNINSRGGDFFAGINIYNQLREHDGPVTVRVLGLAASAASLIAMASDNLKIAKAGFLMIHKARGGVFGVDDDFEAAVGLFRQFDASMAGVYADRSGNNLEQIAAWMAHAKGQGTFFNGEEAVEHGFADSLLSSDEIESGGEPEAVMDAARYVRAVLKQTNHSRDQCRALVAEIAGGTPRAVPNVTPRADESIAAAMMQRLNRIKD
jgi:ATP-dependent protease ClpP protease subunit